MEVREVIGQEGRYTVSESGVVASLLRGGRVLKQWLSNKGYPMVWLYGDGKARARTVHSLVAEAFIGPRPDGLEVRHRNGVREDNRRENLQWGTRSENMLDAVEHGTDRNAAKTHCKHGHEFTEDNTIRSGRWRACRTCARRRNRESRRRRSGN